ncbi:hypothetical protein Ctha_0571 [Chloroherpeton thalassium ATCC 35110]|uniref:Glycosyltransferase subfamily 4-like N-terminal domain-containing protein n=2 Tax=Chloroherpeton thalassium TaxID=100716 RepID=B3QV88_CHLT3|nr:hypothetical protein Ctha_0571 [Chloroherpeton thalassium ATCC 35110]
MGISGVQRTAKFVKYLPKYGWKPIVLTIEPHAYYAYDETLVDDLKPLAVEVFRTSTKKVTRMNAIGKKKREAKLSSASIERAMSMISQVFRIPDGKISWKKPALLMADEIFKKHPDIKVIFSTAPPYTAHLVAEELRRKYQLPIVLDFREPWVENPSNFYLTPFHKRRQNTLEELVIRSADKIITPNREIKEIFLRKYYERLTHYDITIIPHGFDPTDFNAMNAITRGDKKLRFVHSGIFRNQNLPKPFFRGLKYALEKRPELKEKIEVRFVGICQKEFIKQAESFGLRDIVEVRGHKNHRETIDENMKADVLWALLGNVPNNHAISCGKIFEYVACGKTLFGIMPQGASRNFILEANGLVASPDNIEEIGQKILEIAALWEKNQLPVPAPDVVEKYNREVLTGMLAKEFEEQVSLD